MKRAIKKFAKWYSKFNVDSKQFFPNYYFYKPLFIAWLVLSILLIIFSMALYGTNEYGFIECYDNAGYLGCENPLYNPECETGVCSVQTINAGESMGVKPPFLVVNFNSIIFFLGALIFGINHLLFNQWGKILWIKIK